MRMVILGVFLLGTPNAFGKDTSGSFAIKGVGTHSCSTFVEAVKNRSADLNQYLGFLTGYISAINEVRDNTFDVTPWQQMDTLMLVALQQCRLSPSRPFSVAVSSMVQYFSQNKLNEQQAQVELSANEHRVLLYPQVISQMQSELARRGYDNQDVAKGLYQFSADSGISAENPFSQIVMLKLLFGTNVRED